MTTSPTTLSLKALRDAGYVAAVVEHFNPHKRIRQDLFGFIDIIAIRPGETLAVQTTSRSNMAARVRKIAEHPNVAAVRGDNGAAGLLAAAEKALAACEMHLYAAVASYRHHRSRCN